jgi:hypothetical protein
MGAEVFIRGEAGAADFAHKFVRHLFGDRSASRMIVGYI